MSCQQCAYRSAKQPSPRVGEASSNRPSLARLQPEPTKIVHNKSNNNKKHVYLYVTFHWCSSPKTISLAKKMGECVSSTGQQCLSLYKKKGCRPFQKAVWTPAPTLLEVDSSHQMPSRLPVPRPSRGGPCRSQPPLARRAACPS